ncbi:MAG TPA: enoyl-CoA hydratase [Acetobacteraceae bacterium]|nr:enoyl-CoA hydratase [Acetobacteraceae bacterium]
MDAIIEQSSPLRVERDARGVVRLTLNRPASFNALSDSMLAALQEALDALREDAGARAVILAAEGRAFCAGHDLKEMLAAPDEDRYRDLFARCSRMMLSLQALPQPVIARVQGVATAAGCQLVAMCDLAVAAEEARFAVSGINLGLFCSTPSVALARAMPRKQAMEMLLTGGMIGAAEAAERGLINRAVPAAALDGEIEALVSAILAKPAEAIAIGKAQFYRQIELPIDAAYELAGSAMARNMMQACALRGVDDFVNKRKPRGG